jgi:universal stress protein A
MDIHIHRILCPVDFSTSSDYAFQYALAIATAHQATVELLHVTEISAYGEEPNGKDRGYDESYEDSLRVRLSEIAAAVDTHVPITTNLAAGVPYIEIIKRAKSLPADLIVLGTHGRTGLKHLLIGSVAERVVRTSFCPTLTVRHPTHRMSGDL